MKKGYFLSVFIGVALIITSCRKDYQKLSTEFVRNLPDSCEFLLQVDNDAEHLVYYKLKHNKDAFFCYNTTTNQVEIISVPEIDLPTPKNIGAGEKSIMIGYKDRNDEDILSTDEMLYGNSVIMKYDIKTRKFQKFIDCSDFHFDNNAKQILLVTYDIDRYGGGSRTDDVYDFDGKLLTSKEVEVFDFQEVESGTNAAKQKETSIGIDEELDDFQSVIEGAKTMMDDGWPTTSNMGIKICDAYDETYDRLLRLHSRGFSYQQELRFQKLSNEAERVFNQWKSMSE